VTQLITRLARKLRFSTKHGSYGQGSIRKGWGILHSKVGENETVRESQGKSKYQGAKVNKDAEKSLNCFTQTAYNSSKFFLLASLADYLYLHF